MTNQVPLSVLQSQTTAAEDQRESGILRVLNEIYAVGTDDLDAGPSQKKQRFQEELVDKYVVVSSTNHPEFDASRKLRDDYSEPENSSPTLRSHIGRAVGPNPPPVP